MAAALPHPTPPRPPHVLCPLLPPCALGLGAWNLRDVRFLTGSQLASWGVACFSNPRFSEADLCGTQGQGGPSFIKASAARHRAAGRGSWVPAGLPTNPAAHASPPTVCCAICPPSLSLHPSSPNRSLSTC